MKISNVCAILAAAGLATTAVAQDSVSSVGTGLPGDGPNAFSNDDQVDNYVLDLTPFTTSWGTEFGIGVLHKSPNVDSFAAFFGSLVSAQAISQNSIDATISGDYAMWTVAGGGVSANNDDMLNMNVNLVDAPTWQQSAMFAGFSGDNETINGSIINVDLTDSSRLYVTRVLGAINQDQATQTGNTYEAGVGGVDAAGNTYFRIDDFGSTGGPSGNNLVRIRLADRAGYNQIQGPGITADDAGATDGLIVGSGTTITVPTAIPAEQFGGNGALGAAAFGTQFFSGDPVVNQGDSHLVGIGNDHRGGPAYTPFTWDGFANPGIGTMSITASNGTPDPGSRKTVNVFAIDSAGAPIVGSQRLFDPGNSLVDPCNGFAFVNEPGEQLAGVHHSSQASFRGGAGQTDVQIVNGDLYAAITLTDSDDDIDPDQGVVVFIETAGGAVSKELVAYTGFAGGKVIVDGPAGARIGEIQAVDIAFPGAQGPSISSPSFDSAGNVWFTAPYSLDAEFGSNFGLFRAVRRATGCWDLELVVNTGFNDGTTWTGANSGTNVRLTRIETADGNSISSGAFFSSNVNAEPALGLDLTGVPASDPRHLGGLVLGGSFSYDVNGDGIHDNPTSALGDPNSVDEAYSGLIYIGAITDRPVSVNDCAGDLNNDGVVNLGDFGAFGAAFGSMTGDANYNPAADFNSDGFVNLGDFGAFGADFGRTDCLD